MKKFHVQFLLKVAYLAAEWRLRNMQPKGGPGHVLFLGHHHKITEMPEFHAREYIPKAFRLKPGFNQNERWVCDKSGRHR